MIKIDRSFGILAFILIGFYSGCKDDVEYVDSSDPSAIQINDITDNTIVVYTGETNQVNLSVLPDDAILDDAVAYEYLSGDTNVFTVAANGLITGIAPGETVLTVTSTNYTGLRTMAMVSVTDRMYEVTSINVEEPFLDYTMPPGATLELDDYLTIFPENATNKKVSYESSNPSSVIANETGTIEAVAPGEATITITAQDGSGTATTIHIVVREAGYQDADRTGWTVSLSHDIPDDTAISNSAESLIDGSTSTCLSMVKPGKSYGGITVGSDEQVHFVIDMQEATSFDYFRIRHRTSNSYTYLRVWGVSLYGSDNGTDFTPIAENEAIDYEATEDTVDLPVQVTFRYIRMTYDLWDPDSGSTIQIAELNLGTKNYQ